MNPRGGRASLTLILGASFARSVRVIGGCRHGVVGDLADPHPGVDSDWKIRDVGEFQGEVAIKPRIDEPRRGVNK